MLNVALPSYTGHASTVPHFWSGGAAAVDAPAPFWRRSSLENIALDHAVNADWEKQGERERERKKNNRLWVLVSSSPPSPNTLVSWGSGIHHGGGAGAVMPRRLVHVNTRWLWEGRSPCAPSLINAAPCFPHKVSISTLMHLPVKVSEPGLAHY